MGLASYIKQHNATLGVLLGVVGIVFGFYAYLKPIQPSPDLAFYVQSVVNILKINQPVENLNVYFRDRDIRRDSLNLRMYRVCLVNQGSSIREIDYAQDKPFGFRVENGIIAKCAPFDTSNSKYLYQELSPQLVDSNTVYFKKAIIENEQPVFIDILLLHKSSEAPRLRPLGKITSLDRIKVVDQPYRQTTLISGTLWLLGFVLGIALLIYLNQWRRYIVTYRIIQPLRKRRLSRSYGYPYKQLSPIQAKLLDACVLVKKKSFMNILQVLTNQNTEELIRKEEETQRIVEACQELIKERKITVYKSELSYTDDLLKVVDVLHKSELLHRSEDGTITFVSGFREEATLTLHLLANTNKPSLKEMFEDEEAEKRDARGNFSDSREQKK